MKSLSRITSFFSKWTAEVARQPALMFSLVLGPFLVLLAFGEGVEIGGPRPRTLVVQQAGEGQALQPLPEELGDHVTIVGETSDLEEARRRLRDGEVDAVAVLPPDPEGTISNGEHVPIQILTSEIDPVRKSYARAYLNDQIATLNQRTIASAIEEAQASVGDVQGHVAAAREFLAEARSARGDLARTRSQVQELQAVVGPLALAADRVTTAVRGVSFVVPGIGRAESEVDRLQALIADVERNVDALDARLAGAPDGSGIPTDDELAQIEADLTEIERVVTEVQNIPPEVLSAPFRLQLDSVAPFVPTFAGFYAPAVLALLLQHLAITLGALSMARTRLIGLMDLLRTSPVRAVEVVAGNYLSYGALSALAGALLVGLVVWLLGVPIFGSYVVVAVALVLLILAALGLGFVISLLSSSEQQAAQVSMLILLCSIFFSGFVFSLDRITFPVRILSYALPSTYAIRTLQDVMLRGVVREPGDLAVLGAVAAVLFAATLFLFRREFRPA